MTSKRALEELRRQEVVRLVDPADVPRRYVLVEGESVLGEQASLTRPEALL